MKRRPGAVGSLVGIVRAAFGGASDRELLGLVVEGCAGLVGESGAAKPARPRKAAPLPRGSSGRGGGAVVKVRASEGSGGPAEVRGEVLSVEETRRAVDGLRRGR